MSALHPFELPASPDAPLLLHGDCLTLLRSLPAASVDVVITDPPAGVGFMNRAWDSFSGYAPVTQRGREAAVYLGADPLVRRAAELLHGLALSSRTDGLPVQAEALDVALRLLELTRAAPLLPAWARGFVLFMVDVWTEVDRVLKPGGWVCAWALPKTADLAGLAMRASGWATCSSREGWTVHDSLLHLFGSGFPKSHNVSKALDALAGAEREVLAPGINAAAKSRHAAKRLADGELAPTYFAAPEGPTITAPATPEAQRWDGWGTALAPGHEQWLLARKSLDGCATVRLRDLTGWDYAWSSKSLDLATAKGRASAFKRWPGLADIHAADVAAHAEADAAWTERLAAAVERERELDAATSDDAPDEDCAELFTARAVIEALKASWPRLPAWSLASGRSLRPGFPNVVRLVRDGEVVDERESGKYSAAPITTVAVQVLAHGCGALNIDATRTPASESDREAMRVPQPALGVGETNALGFGHGRNGERFEPAPGGRWPSNVLLTEGGDGCPVAELDRQSGHLASRGNINPESLSVGGQGVYGTYGRGETLRGSHDEGGGASRFFPRFRYQAKAHDRTAGLRTDTTNKHPTHKSVDLMRWLVRLLAAKAEHTGGGAAIVLDPFMGSGTTGVACVAERVRFIGIERDPVSDGDHDSFGVARSRIMAAIGSPEAAAEANEKAPERAQLALL